MSLLWRTAVSMGEFPFTEYEGDTGSSPSSIRLHVPLADEKVPADGEYVSLDHQRIENVPMNKFRATQKYVYLDHAKKLAQIPKEAWDSAQPHDLPSVSLHADGTAHINEGHHRVVAAKLRGDSEIRARIENRRADA